MICLGSHATSPGKRQTINDPDCYCTATVLLDCTASSQCEAMIPRFGSLEHCDRGIRRVCKGGHI